MDFLIVICLVLFVLCGWLVRQRASLVQKLNQAEERLSARDDALERTAREYADLIGQINHLLSTEQIDQIYATFPEALSKVYGFPYVWIDQINPEDGRLQVAGGFHTAMGRGGDPLGLGFSFSQKVIASGKARYYKNLLTEETSSLPRFEQSDITTLISIPLGSARHCWGVLHLCDADEHMVTPATLENIKLLANLLSLGIEGRRNRARLKARDAELRAFSSLIPDAVISTDSQGEIKAVNDSFVDMFDYSRADILGSRISLLMPPDIAEQYDTFIQRYLETRERRLIGVTREFTAMRRDGSLFPIELSVMEANPDGCPGFTGIIRDISERKQREAQLQQARLKADEAHLGRQRFLAGISHALRTPLNGIIGMTDLMQETPLNGDQQDYMVALMESAQSLTENLEGMLDIARLEGGQARFEQQAIDPRAILDEVGEIIASAERDSQVEIVVHPATNLALGLVGDSDRLRLILLHLARHMIHDTREGALIIRANTQREAQTAVSLRMSVTRTHGQISPLSLDLLKLAPEEGIPIDSPHASVALNLYIARCLASLMGGRLYHERVEGGGHSLALEVTVACREDAQPLESSVLAPVRCLVQAPGHTAEAIASMLAAYGCQPMCIEPGDSPLIHMRQAVAQERAFHALIFPFRLQGHGTRELVQAIKQDAALAETHLVLLCPKDNTGDALHLFEDGVGFCLAQPVKQKRLVEALLQVRRDQVPLTRMPDRAPVRKPKARILIVEDNHINQRLVSKVLESLPCELVIASNGREGVDAVQAQHFDLVLMDLQMPIINGFEATAEIRCLDGDKGRVPIIAMTADVVKVSRRECLDAGMNDFISKPIRIRELISLVQKYIG